VPSAAWWWPTPSGCDQEFTLTGAIITLSRSPQRINARGPLRVRYSPTPSVAPDEVLCAT